MSPSRLRSDKKHLDTLVLLLLHRGNSVTSQYPLSQNDYRQEKIIFELFSGALQENPVRAPGAIT